MASKKPIKKVADAASSNSDESDEDILILPGENAIDPYSQPTGGENQQSKQTAGHNFVHLHF
jgi:hypothetical protein